MDICDSQFSGEEILDMFSNAELVFAGTSSVLIKACRMRRDFKILVFRCIKSKVFRSHIESDRKILGIGQDHFVYL